MNPLITSAFLAVMDCNVIVVDWRGAANAGYNTAANAVPSVGQHLGDFITWLIRNGGGNMNQVHLVGFSLGAHVVGNAGRRVGGQVSRVTGMVPCTLFYRYFYISISTKLSPSILMYDWAIRFVQQISFIYFFYYSIGFYYISFKCFRSKLLGLHIIFIFI